MSHTENDRRRMSEKVGFYCSALLLGLLAVMIAFAIHGAVDPERGAFAVTGIILLLGPILLFFASLTCGILMYWYDCRLRYHLSWVLVLLVCLGVVATIQLYTSH